jgi:hypothetical protein
MFGVPELMIVLVLVAVYAVPLVAAIWALVTLKRIQTGQEAVQARLESIERILQRG